MNKSSEVVSKITGSVKGFGLDGVSPNIISEGANLLIHLSPYPIVARVAVYLSNEIPEKAYDVLNKEMEVALYLMNENVPIVMPHEISDNKPHYIDGFWMTFWEHIIPIKNHVITSQEALKSINTLSTAMSFYPDVLPYLWVWDRLSISVERLRKNSDFRILSILNEFDLVDSQIRAIAPNQLVSCHGDAHYGNMISSSRGWLWLDFEDASSMPRFWDKVSYIGNRVLFKGFNEPIFKSVIDDKTITNNFAEFKLMLKARTLMSFIGNYDLALEGYGDFSFAKKQLNIIGDFFLKLDSLSL